MNAREVLKRLQADGWFEIAQKGSHKQLKHASKPGKVTIPIHGNADLSLMVIKSIERQAGVSLVSLRRGK
jgi:predicted RNA binding protein YcfA (HicA-like mRNA interferase family)